ncbi:MAG: hypothetical protein KKF54_02800 [Candidatus Omnitrophica bacterium]|nr:hypothetical protein [Candidatus Omnitrophota bacterium]
MELKRVIFDLRYQPFFAWIDKKGEILNLINESKLFDSLGFSENLIESKYVKGDIFRNFNLGITMCVTKLWSHLFPN